MFYGKISTNELKTDDASLIHLEKVMSWEGCIVHRLTFENFSGGIFFDPRLPYTIEDSLFIDSTNKLVVLMSGCIYNRRVISEENKIVPKNITDPALVATLYLQQGAKFIQQLNGDFAIFIYQANNSTSFLFRDHVGIKPLCYTQKEQCLYFSTDIIGLCRTFHKESNLNIECLLRPFKTVDNIQTLNAKVLKLYPGHYLSYTPYGLFIEKYWMPENIHIDISLTRAQVLSDLKTLLLHAVRIRSDKRFKAGAHISGGLDSGIVAALTREEYSEQENFYGYSWSPSDIDFVDFEFDEREYVRKICEMSVISPTFVNVTMDDVIRLSKKWLNAGVNFQEAKILEKADEHKTNLIFSGWGGDEFISKGNTGIDCDLFFNCQWDEFFQRNPLSRPKELLGTLLFQIFFPVAHILPSATKQNHLKLVRYLKDPYKQEHKESLKKFFFFRSRREVHLGHLYDYHLSDRTEFWSTNGYTHGVEYRYPLLDRRIIEYMLKVPSKHLIKGKYARIVLREISEGILPEEIRWRPSKVDPLYFAVLKEINWKAGTYFIDELSTFKKNVHLQCFDFDLLERDLELFNRNDDKEALAWLYTDIFSIKMIHEFTLGYFE